MATKKPSNGTGVQNIKERKPIVEYLISSGEMYLYTLIFSVFGIIFIIDTIALWIKLLIGIVFISPVIIVMFQKGKNAGEKEYKRLNKSVLSDIHAQKVEKIKVYKSIFHTLPFVISALILIALSVLLKQQWLQGTMLLIFIPITLVFMGLGLLKFETGFISWYSVLAIGIFTVLVSISFIAGYFYSVIALRKRSNEIVNEIRSYE